MRRRRNPGRKGAIKALEWIAGDDDDDNAPEALSILLTVAGDMSDPARTAAIGALFWPAAEGIWESELRDLETAREFLVAFARDKSDPDRLVAIETLGRVARFGGCDVLDALVALASDQDGDSHLAAADALRGAYMRPDFVGVDDLQRACENPRVWAALQRGA